MGMKRAIFETFDFLAPIIFWPIFLDLMDQKIVRFLKVLSKISFFMPINHMKEFLKYTHTEALFCQLFA